MRLIDVLGDSTLVFLDTSPVIYFTDANPSYLPITESFFELLDSGDVMAATSPITLAECLVVPLRSNDIQGVNLYTDLLTNNPHINFMHTNKDIARKSAELRAKYMLKLPDALQLATALNAQCDVFLTNDARLKRVNDLQVVVLDDFQA